MTHTSQIPRTQTKRYKICTHTLQNVHVSLNMLFNCHKPGGKENGKRNGNGKSNAVKKIVGEESVDVFCMFYDNKYASPPTKDLILI